MTKDELHLLVVQMRNDLNTLHRALDRVTVISEALVKDDTINGVVMDRVPLRVDQIQKTFLEIYGGRAFDEDIEFARTIERLHKIGD